MLCYSCFEQGKELPAVALCRSCNAGLRLDHRDRASAPRRAVEPAMSASQAPDRRLLFVADAAVAWQERGLEKHLEKRFGLPLMSYAVDPRGHATGAQRR